MSITYYIGIREKGSLNVTIQHNNIASGKKTTYAELPIRLDLSNSSPSGFGCGYQGSGPYQLAVALLAHAFDDNFAIEHAGKVKDNLISQLPQQKIWCFEQDRFRGIVNEIIGLAKWGNPEDTEALYV